MKAELELVVICKHRSRLYWRRDRQDLGPDRDRWCERLSHTPKLVLKLEIGDSFASMIQ